MALKEYKYGDRTYLFEEDEAPEGAELIGDVKESVSPISFEQANEPPKAGRARRNKQAPAPENKDAAPADESAEDDGTSDED